METLPIINPFNWGYNGTVKVFANDKTVNIPLKDKDEKTDLEHFISQNVPSLKDEATFQLKPYLFTGILQTMYLAAANLTNKFPVFYGREIREFSDSGVASIDWVMNSWEDKYQSNRTTGSYNKATFSDDASKTHRENWPRLHPRTRYLSDSEVQTVFKDERPLILVLHGLAGGSHEPIIRSLTNDLSHIDNGRFEVAVLNCRGCARTRITNRQLFTGLFTSDIEEVLAAEKQRHPSRKIYAVGFSFGAIQLANYCAKMGDNTLLTAAAYLCSPWDLVKSAERMRDNFWSNKLFSKSLAQFLYRLMKVNWETLRVEDNYKPLQVPTIEHPEGWSFTDANLEIAKNATSTITFDNIFTAPSLGMKTAFEYYTAASSTPKIKDIRIPSLVINSTDDPITGDECLPTKEVMANPNFVMCKTDLGGHLAYLDSNDNSWATAQIAEFFYKFDELVL